MWIELLLSRNGDDESATVLGEYYKSTIHQLTREDSQCYQQGIEYRICTLLHLLPIYMTRVCCRLITELVKTNHSKSETKEATDMCIHVLIIPLIMDPLLMIMLDGIGGGCPCWYFRRARRQTVGSQFSQVLSWE